MPYGTVNADVIGTSVAGANLGAGNASLMKNRIINGAMVIDQRNNGSAITAAGFTVDRWYNYVSQSSKSSVGRSTTAPTGFAYSIGVTSSSAYSITSSDYFMLYQGIEGFNWYDLGWGTANAKPVTLSFWVQSSLTGTFGGSLQNWNQNRSYPFTYTVNAANTWEQKTITIAGDTSGTWEGATNAGAAEVNFSYGMGSTKSGTAGAWAAGNYLSATGATSVVGTSGATFYITGVQLEVGSSATGYEYRQYGTELQLCQRYLPAYNAQTGVNETFGTFVSGTTTTRIWGTFQFPVTTRTAPTGITISSASDFVGGGQTTNFTVSSFNYQYASRYGASIYINGSGGTAGQAISLYLNTTSALLLFTGCEL